MHPLPHDSRLLAGKHEAFYGSEASFFFSSSAQRE